MHPSTNNLPEVLAPAADITCLEFALCYGADAVYLGGNSFGMRRGRANFNSEQLIKAVDMAHLQGKKIYYTLNTTPMPEEVDDLPSAIIEAANAGVDAFIVADLGVTMLCRKLAPQVEIHLSTQVGITNEYAVEAAAELGATRVVLARELSLEQIARIREKSPREIQLEAFVHGAMCMSFSGRCLLSSYLGGRDANRGACYQPCRHSYRLVNDEGVELPIAEEEGGSYILNAEDLCMAPYLDRLANAGIDSFKIEGRSKSFYYVASTTSCYRRATDKIRTAPYDCGEDVKAELMRTSHRPYGTGFYLGVEGAKQAIETGGYIKGGEPLAVVEKVENGRIYCVQRGKFTEGEKLNMLTPSGESVDITPLELADEDGNMINATPHAMQKFSLGAEMAINSSVVKNSILRRIT